MTVDTGKVAGRRTLRYADLDALLADAERAVAENYRPIGNWSAGQILVHLARTMNGSIDGLPLRPPWLIRWIIRLFMKRRLIEGPMPAGFRLPAKAAKLLVADATDNATGLVELRAAIERLKREPHRAPNSMLGAISREQSDRLALSHAALHMSFLVPR